MRPCLRKKGGMEEGFLDGDVGETVVGRGGIFGTITFDGPSILLLSDMLNGYDFELMKGADGKGLFFIG